MSTTRRRHTLKHLAALAAPAIALTGCDSQRPAVAAKPVEDQRKRRIAESTGEPGSQALPSQADIDSAISKWNVWTEPNAGGPRPLLVAAGSALDLSGIALNPVNSRLGKRGLGFNLLGFRLPSAAEIPSFVDAVKRNGHPYIRFFALDPWFGHGSTVFPAGDPYGCAFDAGRVDLWWRYLAALSDAGIQYSVEFLFLASAMMPGRKPWPDSPEPAAQSLILRATLNEPNAVRHWKNCFEVLCNRRNPYFARPRKIIEDNNCVFIGSGNENNLWNRGLYYFGRGESDAAGVIQPFFDKWQANNGKTSHGVPAVGGGQAAATAAYGKFLLDVHADSYKVMRQHAQDAGYRGKMTAVNYIPDVYDGILRSETLDMVDCHMYFDLDDDGLHSANRSMIGDRFHNANWLASGMVHGKRTAITEYAVGGPSPWGYEYPFAYALAALQDLDWIAQFSRMVNTLDPRDPMVWPGWFEKHVQTGQDATKDVVSAAACRIGAFLFNRGDVSRSETVLGFVVRREKTLAQNPPWYTNWPRSIASLGLLCGIRSVAEADVGSSLQWIGKGTPPTRIYDPLNDGATWNKPLSKWIEELKAGKLLTAENTSDERTGVFESDTRELRINTRNKSARVVTPRSHVIIWDDDEQVDETPFLMLDAATHRGLVSIHDISATPGPLTSTSRALMMHLTEVRGSKSDGTGPYDFRENGSTKWGPSNYERITTYAISGPRGIGWRKESMMPSRVRGGKAIVRIALPAGNVTVHKLDIRGNRIGTIPTHRLRDNTVRMVLDNTSPDALQQTVYYEVLVAAAA